MPNNPSHYGKQKHTEVTKIIKLVNTQEHFRYTLSLKELNFRNGKPFQYSCLENSTDREAWWATVQGVAKSWPRLSS